MEWNDWHARVWRGKVATAARAVIPTGYRELDRALPGGGWPLGAITEILVDGYGIGELGLLMPALEALTKEDPARPKKWVSWIAPPFVPYAPALQQHGVNIDRLLMIHPTSGNKNRLWAIEQAVRSGASAGVLAWVAALPKTSFCGACSWRPRIKDAGFCCFDRQVRVYSARRPRCESICRKRSRMRIRRLAWRSSNAEAGGRASSM